MHYTIEHLIRGNEETIEFYKNAASRWKEIVKNNKGKTSEELARVLTSEQMWFEHNCGSRWVGQEIMVVTGIAQFYTTQDGFGNNLKYAKWIYDAFMESYCSLEVKGHARDIATSYHLDEY